MSIQPSMAILANEYLEYRKQLGYELKTVAQLLLRFANYADQAGHKGAVTTELAVRWAALAESASGAHRAYRLTVVRGFATYRALFDPETEIPPCNIFGPPYRRRSPYIYSPTEIAEILQVSACLPPAGKLRSHTYSTFFGLLACTGLRNREARRLTRADVDLERQLLLIRESKFRKSRLVPLHDSALQMLAAYGRLRDQFFPSAQTDAFFLNLRGAPLSDTAVQWAFRKVRQQITWRTGQGIHRPRLHDFRHTFACHRLLAWYRQGVDVHHAIAALSTYLGHANVNCTFWYLTGTPELLELAGQRFERFSIPSDGGAA